jgi:hypothetical protein
MTTTFKLLMFLGTSTVMALDVLRSIQKSGGSTLKSLFDDITEKLNLASSQNKLEPSIIHVSRVLKDLSKFLKETQAETMQYQLKSARDFSFTLAKLYQAALLERILILMQSFFLRFMIIHKIDFTDVSCIKTSSK